MAMVGYLCFLHPSASGPQLMPGADKLVHFGMYFGTCSTLWWEYARHHMRLAPWRVTLGAIAAPILMSGAIELLQEYCTTYRGGDWADFLANSLGVLAAAVLGRYGLWPLYDDGE